VSSKKKVAVETQEPIREIDSVESELRRMFGVRSFLFRPEDDDFTGEPVRIEVKALKVGQYHDLSDVVARLAYKSFVEKASIEQIIATGLEDVFRILRALVSIPDAPSLTLDDLPIEVLPECLTLFLRGISPGKWGALVAEARERFPFLANLTVPEGEDGESEKPGQSGTTTQS